MIRELLVFILMIAGLIFTGWLWMDYGLQGDKYSGYSLIGGVGFAVFFFLICGIWWAFEKLIYAIYLS